MILDSLLEMSAATFGERSFQSSPESSECLELVYAQRQPFGTNPQRSQALPLLLPAELRDLRCGTAGPFLAHFRVTVLGRSNTAHSGTPPNATKWSATATLLGTTPTTAQREHFSREQKNPSHLTATVDVGDPHLGEVVLGELARQSLEAHRQLRRVRTQLGDQLVDRTLAALVAIQACPPQYLDRFQRCASLFVDLCTNSCTKARNGATLLGRPIPHWVRSWRSSTCSTAGSAAIRRTLGTDTPARSATSIWSRPAASSAWT